MEIAALNAGALGIEIQGYPDGTIEVQGLPSNKGNSTVREEVLSTVRTITISRAVAIRVLEGMLKGDDVHYDLELMKGDHGVIAEGTVTFQLPKGAHLRSMTASIVFEVSRYDACMVYASENPSITDVTRAQEQLAEEIVLDDLLEEGRKTDVVSVPGDDIELDEESEQWKRFCAPLHYTIQVRFHEFLFAMINAL